MKLLQKIKEYCRDVAFLFITLLITLVMASVVISPLLLIVIILSEEY